MGKGCWRRGTMPGGPGAPGVVVVVGGGGCGVERGPPELDVESASSASSVGWLDRQGGRIGTEGSAGGEWLLGCGVGA